MAATKEHRGNKLIDAIKNSVKGAELIKIDPATNRKAYFRFRGLDFVCSSKLTVLECGFGRLKATGRAETEDSKMLSKRLKAASHN